MTLLPKSNKNRLLDIIVQQMPLPWLPSPITLDTLSDVAQQMYCYQGDVSSFDKEWQIYQPWRFSYLDYQHFQKNIMTDSNTQQIVTESIGVEYNKVHDFYTMKKGEIERKIQSLKHNKKNNDALKTLILEIHHLHHFAKLNYCGFLILFMQYDRLFGSSDLLRRMLINKPFWDHSIVSFHFTFQLNRLLFSVNQQQQQQVMKEVPQVTESFFSAVESINKYRKPVHPLSVSSSTSTTSTFQSCATALSHHEQELPKHSNKVKKYWVHPDNILEVMLLLSKEKMVLLDTNINPSNTYTAVDEVGHPEGLKSKFIAMSPVSLHHVKAEQQQQVTNSNGKVKVTTVYMDTPDFNIYTERVVELPISNTQDRKLLSTNDKYTTTRVRWYDDKGEGEEGYSAIEQKVYYKQSHHHHDHHHHDGKGYKGLGKKPQQEIESNNENHHHWVKQRFWLKSRHLKSWINGDHSYATALNKSTCQFRTEGLPTLHTEDKERMINACLQIERDIHNKLQVPVLKTTQYRTVYTSIDNTVTISIDKDIAMMRPLDTLEPTKEKMTQSNHRQMTTESNQYPYYNLTASTDITRFPYCVVQIEQREDDIEWLKKLESSPLLEPVHDFSLFLHGVGTLYCDGVHVFPSWLTKMEFLDIRQCAHRGSLLITPPPEEELITKEEPIVASSTVSSTAADDANYWSSNTIATIITCYDEEDDDDIFIKRPILSSSASSCSSLLSPTIQAPGKLRRSFDSYCSFDHPTSSRSDPTNCKSCMNKMLSMESSRSSSRMNHHHPYHRRKRGRKSNVDYPTLYSVIRDAFAWCSRGKDGEKEPLLPSSPSSAALNSDNNNTITRYTNNHDEESNTVARTENQPSSTARASIITLSCIIMSLSISYFFYVFVTKIKIHK